MRRSRIVETVVRDPSRLRFLILACLAVLCAFTGGSYRATMPSLAIMRPGLVLGIGIMAALPGPWDWRGLKIPTGLLTLFAATMAIQLVPVPPDWWAAMPGHDCYADLAALSPSAWRPISLAPDLTINSLLALLPATAILIAFAGLNERDRWNTVWIALGLCSGSAAVALLQVVGGAGPASIDAGNDSGVTGLLANRNHGAVLLGLALPLAAAALGTQPWKSTTRLLALGAVAAVVLPLVLLTGSRQGTVLVLLAGGSAAALLVDRQGRGDSCWRHWPLAGVAAVLVLILVVALLGGRAFSIVRLGELIDPSTEVRWRSLPITLQMTRDFWPVGIGYGAFDPVYRGYEPDAFLHSSFFNRAHNDLIETMMSGGLPALLLLAGLLAWLGTMMVRTLRAGPRMDLSGLGRAALIVVAMLLLASLVDYPLRTGAMSYVFALACCLLAVKPTPPGHRSARRRSGRET